MIKKALINNIITTSEYRALYICKDKKLNTITHNILRTGKVLNVTTLLDTIHFAYESNVLTANDYKSLLIDNNQDLFTPFHYVLISGNIYCLKKYMSFVKRALGLNIINLSEYKDLLTSSNKSKFNCIHQASNNGDLTFVKALMAELESTLDDVTILGLLNEKNIYTHVPHISSNYKNYVEMNKYLDNQRVIYQTKINIRLLNNYKAKK
jgi:hypothetical protein